MQVSTIYITSVSGYLHFTFKICEIVAYTGMVQQFHDFFESLFGGFFEFGPIVGRAPAAMMADEKEKRISRAV